MANASPRISSPDVGDTPQPQGKLFTKKGSEEKYKHAARKKTWAVKITREEKREEN